MREKKKKLLSILAKISNITLAQFCLFNNFCFTTFHWMKNRIDCDYPINVMDFYFFFAPYNDKNDNFNQLITISTSTNLREAHFSKLLLWKTILSFDVNWWKFKNELTMTKKKLFHAQYVHLWPCLQFFPISYSYTRSTYSTNIIGPV